MTGVQTCALPICITFILNKPIITIFHSVLPNPDEKRKKIVLAIADLSDRIIVLTNKSKEILINQYGYRKLNMKVIQIGRASCRERV